MNNPLPTEFLSEISHCWNLPHVCPCPALSVTGSPARSVTRLVLQTPDGRSFVLEAVPASRRPQREHQFRTLQFLSGHGVHHLAPWLPTADGTAGLLQDGLFWQLRPYLHGAELPRDSYGQDAWRGHAAAQLLTDLHNASQFPALPADPRPPFRLRHYIDILLPVIRQLLPELIPDLTPILAELQDFLAVEETLPLAFAHGDFHPGNIIWGPAQTISGLIDWEFCGWKTAGYDAANLLGCLGMDEPAWLTGPLASSFLHDWNRPAPLDESSLHYLPDLTAALRFAWLREWVVQRNRDLICQELDFIWLLLDNRPLLRDKFQAMAR